MQDVTRDHVVFAGRAWHDLYMQSQLETFERVGSCDLRHLSRCSFFSIVYTEQAR